jgi:DNA-binding NarL/FixJ family response regulator
VTRVLVVEDHAVIRGVVRLACEHSEGLEVVGEAVDGESALEACRDLRPDVVVLDLWLPGDVQGFDVARHIRAEGLPIRILVLTGRGDDQAVFDSIRAGADGFLEKTEGIRYVADALRRVARGDRVFTPEHERVALAALGRLARKARQSSDALDDLTPRELEVLRHLGAGLSVKQVASRLHVSPRTVETHLSRLYRKLGAQNRVQALSRAASLGLIDVA